VGDLVSVNVSERRWGPMLEVERALARADRGLAKGELDRLGDDKHDFPPARWIAKHVLRAALVLTTSRVAAQLAAVVGQIRNRNSEFASVETRTLESSTKGTAEAVWVEIRPRWLLHLERNDR
jgi:hypothetical protein